MSDPKSDPADTHPWLVKLRQARFTRLLLALSLLLFLSPFVALFSSTLGRATASLLVIGLFAVVLIAAAFAVSSTRRQSRVVLILAIVCLILTVLGNRIGSTSLVTAQYLATICFLTYVLCLILRSLFRPSRVDADTIAASLCGYLLIGMVFAVAYSLVIEFDSVAIMVTEAENSFGAEFHFGDEDTANALYFSFVTLTTLGYGDITPRSMPARMLSTTEALLGQIYLIVLVARLVGLHISSQNTQE